MPSIKATPPLLLARGTVPWADDAIHFVERFEASSRVDDWQRPQLTAALLIVDDLRARVQTLLNKGDNE